MKVFHLLFLFVWLHPSLIWGSEASTHFAEVGTEFVFSDLKKGDSRKVVMQKLRNLGFIQIYEERENELVKCNLRLNGFRYELASKLNEGELQFCLIEGQKGWQFSFYEDVVEPQWKNLREILSKKYGKKRSHRSFPNLTDVPLNDKGGYVTDTWDLDDRVLMLTVQFFELKDCCTNQMVEYSCCTLLIQPKKEN